MRWHVISAVFWRNVKQYFSGVLGYLFIVVFVTACAILTFSEQFFADNLSNLDQLTRWFPMLLLVFIPAITMNVWADEKRQGTDAILFTLPASDLEILLGKYFAVAAVYTIALLFSTTQLMALSFIGQPDWGVVFATYLGYWLAGLALLSIGMFASSLTGTVPVAFVYAVLFCAIPVFIGRFFNNLPGLVAQYLPESFSNAIPNLFAMEQLGVDWNLQDFALGLIPLENVVYFLAIIAFMLYLNLVVISRRHWSRGQQVSLGGQFAVRVISLAVALLATLFIVNQASSWLTTRADMTAEKLYTLDPTTRQTLAKAVESDQLVTIQSFVSRDVPRSFVNARKQFQGLLRQFDYYGGNNIQIRPVTIEPNSDREIEAKQLGIEPKKDRSKVDGRIVEQDVYMGAYVSGPKDDALLPIIENDSSIEYQLTHAVATTTDDSRKITLGIVDTDAFFSGITDGNRRIAWGPYVETSNWFGKQYRIRNIAQDDLSQYVQSAEPTNPAVPGAEGDEPEKKEAPDVLLVPDPSSLTDAATNTLLQYMDEGNPVVFLADPMPFFWTSRAPDVLGILNAPRMPRVSPNSPYAQFLSSAFQAKADEGRCTKICNRLGIEWDNGRVAWNLYNPHPNFKGSWLDPSGQSFWPAGFGSYDHAFVFARNHSDHVAFNPESEISAGLKEVLFFYPGSVRKSSGANTTFIPLVTLEKTSGTTDWDALTEVPTDVANVYDPRTGRLSRREQKRPSQFTGEDMIVLNPQPAAFLDSDEHVIAARIKSDKTDAVFIADLDFVSNLYQEQIGDDGLGQKLDNISLLQNAIEVLAGEEALVRLRNRRPEPRSLSYVEQATSQFRSERAKAQEAIEKEIRDQLDAERDKLDEEAKKIEGDTSLSFFEKIQRTSQEASDAQKRFEIKEKKLDQKLKIEIDSLEAREQNQIRRTEGFVKMMAILFAPLPAILLGCLVFAVRAGNERSQVKASRRAG